MSHSTLPACARTRTAPNPPPQQIAIARVGAALIAYRINGTADQRAHLRGLVEMATALGAIDPSQHADLMHELFGAPAREVLHA